MRNFRVAYTGDFLNERGDYAYGDNSLGLLAACPFVRYHFLKDLGPRAHDPDYWQRFYSLEVTAEHIRDIDGLVVPAGRHTASCASVELTSPVSLTIPI